MQRRNHPLAILEGAAGYLLPVHFPPPKNGNIWCPIWCPMWLTMINQSQESAWADTDCSALWSPSSMGLTAGPSRSIRPTFMDIHTNLAGHSEMDKIIDDYLWGPSTVTSAVHSNKTVWQPSNCNLAFISKSLVMRTFVHTSDNHGKSFCKANLNAIRGWPPRPHVLADVADVTYAARPAAENIRSLRKTTAGWIQITAWGKELDDCVRVTSYYGYAQFKSDLPKYISEAPGQLFDVL